MTIWAILFYLTIRGVKGCIFNKNLVLIFHFPGVVHLARDEQVLTIPLNAFAAAAAKNNVSIDIGSDHTRTASLTNFH
ncbi:hypothetical protein [African swine fever virus]|nr:hypothetical protein [African swine fever virus]UCX57553.1 hypothetical protein [African swine fever virus]UFQ11257.1 hypothetical protein [African swine fever virus]